MNSFFLNLVTLKMKQRREKTNVGFKVWLTSSYAIETGPVLFLFFIQKLIVEV